MWLWILAGIGGVIGGSALIGQIYAWIADRPNPVWGFMGDFIGVIADIGGAIADAIGDIDIGDIGGGGD